MSKVGQWRLELQERAEYAAGREARASGKPRNGQDIAAGTPRYAWELGWDDQDDDFRPRIGEP